MTRPAFQPRHSRSRPRARRRSRTRSALLGSLLGCTLAVLAVLFWAALARRFAPPSNTDRKQFDAILVLGTPADSDGNPTPEMLERVSEGVREYRRGVAPRILVTGAAAHNQFVEAEAMARVAEAQGVPAAVVFKEPRALDTIQNACFSARILTEHGWRSVEVVTSAQHLPRAAIIFAQLARDWRGANRLEWRMHPSLADLTPDSYRHTADMAEILKTARYLVWAQWAESCPA